LLCTPSNFKAILKVSGAMREIVPSADLPGFTTAMDGGSAGAARSGPSKNLEGLISNQPAADIFRAFRRQREHQ
jgi:hypothetical protein